MKVRTNHAKENKELRARLAEAEELLTAIKTGAVDALITEDRKIFILKGADYAYRVFVENMNEGAITLMLDGTVVYCNKFLAKMIGLPIKKIIGGSIFDFFGPDEIPRLKSILRQRKNQIAQSEFLFKNNNKKLLPVLVSCNFLELKETALCMVITDLTEQRNATFKIKEQREELLHLTRVGKLAEFTSSLAHEISQPLTAILAYAQAAQRLFEGREPQLQQIMQYIINDDLRATGVIQRLRALLKKTAPEMKPVYINALISETVLLITSDATIRNNVLKIELERNLPLVCGDRIQLQQVLLNLISNSFDAIERSRSARSIVIRTSLKDTDTIIVEVRDSGCGISKKDMPQIFTHFFTSKPDGLGMGLSISRSIIEAHGGRLEAKNNPDSGANFYFTLPVGKKDVS
ncbi:MAG: PAS domain-containing protein [Candidatus Omnitrophica bacterium]|nr:PAS domain-containing protein [Candidatus Omnitrophota bacterium]